MEQWREIIVYLIERGWRVNWERTTPTNMAFLTKDMLGFGLILRRLSSTYEIVIIRVDLTVNRVVKDLNQLDDMINDSSGWR
jgi:hypothetical protein